MKLPTAGLMAAILGLAAAAPAQDLDRLPIYRPEQTISGTLRVWGNDGQVENMRRWAEGFRKFQPAVHFELHLTTTAAAVAGVYTGVADFSLMGREIWPVEAQAFQKTLGHELLSVTVMTGSYDAEERTLALGVFVNQANPLSRLTLAQVDAIFTSSRRRGHAPIRTWGDLGLTGEWAQQAIHPIGYAIDSGFAFFLSQTVFRGGVNWIDGYSEHSSLAPPKVPVFTAADLASIQALQQDKYGIAFSAMPFLRPEVKALALKDETSGLGYIPLTRENVYLRTYPLIRDMIAVLNRAPGGPLDPKVREFFRYVLSRDGQAAVVAEGVYLPLIPSLLAEQRKKLN